MRKKPLTKKLSERDAGTPEVRAHLAVSASISCFSAFGSTAAWPGSPLTTWRYSRSTPASALAEYGGIFRTDVEALLTREAVESCIQFRHSATLNPGIPDTYLD